HLAPKSLLGAMWLQFALAVGGDTQHRACPACGKWFAVAPDTVRANKFYCGESCRSRAYRARKEQARTLAGEGKPPKQIAEALATDVEKVKGWLKQPRR